MRNIFAVTSYYISTQPNKSCHPKFTSECCQQTIWYSTQLCVCLWGCLLREPSLQKLGPPNCPGLNFVE